MIPETMRRMPVDGLGDYGDKMIREVYSGYAESRMHLSTGLNEFPIPRLYKKYLQADLSADRFSREYNTQCNYILVACLKLYEKLVASSSCTPVGGYSDNLCITLGATGAISCFFDYYAQHHRDAPVLFAGLNYYAFYKCCEYHHLNAYEVVSGEKGRIAPTVNELLEAIAAVRPKLVVLTLPMNPSGETYTEAELTAIIPALRSHDALLFVDKCQMDEFSSESVYVNVARAVVAEDYLANTIIANSQSKTRSIPGFRMGYIVADQPIVDHVLRKTESDAYCAPTFCITPYVMDLIFRAAQCGMIDDSAGHTLARVKRVFRLGLHSVNDYDDNRYHLLGILDSDVCDHEWVAHRSEMQLNWNEVYGNYGLAMDVLGHHVTDVTRLHGGFNFCIKLRDTRGLGQKGFLQALASATGMKALTECFFTLQPRDDRSSFWLRITAAVRQADFADRIASLRSFLDSV